MLWALIYGLKEATCEMQGLRLEKYGEREVIS